MKKITDYRVLIIDENGESFNFPINVGMQHQECLDEYSHMKQYEYSNVDHVISKNNAIFYNANNGIVVSFLPSRLTDEQLAVLDRMSLKMDDISYMEVRKKTEEGNIDFYLTENIGGRFSDEVLQSYFVKKK